jgi:hypothetical protein
MSFTNDQLRGKGFVIQPDGSYSKENGETGQVNYASYGLPLSVQPRQPLVHENERQLQEQIANWLRLHDTWFFRSRMDKRSTNTVGCPDFLCSVCSVPIAIECKMPGNALSEEQKQAKLLMQANGWQHWTVYQLEEVIAGIRLIQETHK